VKPIYSFQSGYDPANDPFSSSRSSKKEKLATQGPPPKKKGETDLVGKKEEGAYFIKKHNFSLTQSQTHEPSE